MIPKARPKNYVDFEEINRSECEYCALAREMGNLAEKMHTMAFHGSKRDHAMAMRMPINLTGRIPRQIVSEAETTWLADYIIQ